MRPRDEVARGCDEHAQTRPEPDPARDPGLLVDEIVTPAEGTATASVNPAFIVSAALPVGAWAPS